MNRDSKKTKMVRKYSIVLALMFGVLFLTVAYIARLELDQYELAGSMDQTFSFMKSQCVRYDNLQAMDTAKSLIRLVDKTREFARCLGSFDPVNEESLQSYAKEQSLTGIIVLDGDLKPVCEYSGDGTGYAVWEPVIQNKNIQNIITYPQKTYTARNGADSYAAVSRRDEPGIIFAYVHSSETIRDRNQLSIENMLTDYKVDMGGILVITDGDRILSSNEPGYDDQSIYDLAYLIKAGSTQGRRTLDQAQFDGQLCFSGKIRTGNYCLYVFYPYSQIFARRMAVLAVGMLIYIAVLGTMVVFRHRATRRYVDELNRRYEVELQYKAELERAMEETENASRAKTDFLRRMSHDIRTPINGIRGMIEIGNRFPDDMEKQTECRRKIWEASGFLLDLVNDVLDMNKLESGNIQLEEKPFNLHDILQEVAVIIEVQAKKLDLQFSGINMQGDHWDFIGSPLHLRQVFMNILNNAVKYNREHGSISASCRELSVEHGTAVVEFVCVDTGIGMGEEFQQKIFEPFAQENNAVQTTYNGTGLGLSIVKSLVEKMNGTITFTSEKGEGTTFRVVLPLRMDETPRQQSEQPEEGADESLAGLPILLVEDNALNMEIAEFMLEDEGAVITKAWNGQEAVEIFARSEPGTYPVILMDFMMPVMDGLEAARAIRSMDREDASTVVIIAMTANTFTDDVERSRAAGMDEHLSNPLDSVKLIQTVSKYRKHGRES